MNTFKILSLLSGALAAALSVAGCTSHVLVSEVLQQPVDAPVYTKFNLWYSDPSDIPSANVQQGLFLPAGTEVTPESATEDELVFSDGSGARYTISFDPGMHMCPMREFIRMFLTLDPPEKLFEEVRPEFFPYIQRGEVVPGMSRQEVLLSYGPPPACRTPSLRNETWIYWIAPDQTIRVVFRNDRVRNIVNVNE